MNQSTMDRTEAAPRLGVIGVGGAGGNAVTAMARDGIHGVHMMAANCDVQALKRCPVERVPLGRKSTGGFGAGGKLARGAAAAEESIDAIEHSLRGLDMLFVAAGMGGGSGTGAAPVIAAAARRLGILTVGVVTLPFEFEGKRRAAVAEAGLQAMEDAVDALIVVPNQNLFRIAGPNTALRAALTMADDVLSHTVRSIAEPLTMPGMKGLSFADIRAAVAGMGRAMIGFGEGQFAPGRGQRAAEQATNCPLLDAGIEGAQKLIISISGGEDMRLTEVEDAVNRIAKSAAPDADILWSAFQDDTLDGVVRVAVVATGARNVVVPVEIAAPVVEEVLVEIAAPMVEAPVFAASPKPAPLVMLDVLAEVFPIEVVEAEVAESIVVLSNVTPLVFTATEAPEGELTLTSEERLLAPLPFAPRVETLDQPQDDLQPSLLDAAVGAIRAWRPRRTRDVAPPRPISVVEIVSRGRFEEPMRKAG